MPLAAVSRRQPQLTAVLGHGAARDLHLFRRQQLDQLLIGERFGRILRRHQFLDTIFDGQR